MMSSQPSHSVVAKIFQSSWTILMAVILGVYTGLEHRELAAKVAPLGALYLALLKMCVLPILLTAVSVSLGRIVKSEDAGRRLLLMMGIFGLGLLGASAMGVATSWFMQPGSNLPTQHMGVIGNMINKSPYAPNLEIALSEPVTVEPETNGLWTFLDTMVPDNVFSSLSKGENLKVLFFSIFFGLALGHISRKVSSQLFQVMDDAYRAIDTLIRWLMFPLPLALYCLLAAQSSTISLGVLLALGQFLVAACTGFGVLSILNLVIIWRRSRCSLKENLAAMRVPLILAFCSRSSLACIPAAIHSMTLGLHFESRSVKLVTPLGITVCRFGNVIYFGTASLFVAQLYHMSMDLLSLTIVLVGSVLAGMATAGSSGALTLAMMGMILKPLGLPLEAVLVLFIAIDPIVDPFRTLANVHSNCAVAALIAAPNSGNTELEESDALMNRHTEDILDKIGVEGMPSAVVSAYQAKKQARKSTS